MNGYEIFIHILAIGVIIIGIDLIYNGIISHPDTIGVDIGIGVLVIFCGGFLIFVRYIFRDNEKPIRNGAEQ